jgi:CheY-like chemotaxis protein/anti-sigma regulatory factor (Ser/Thr protein kinase)
MNMAKILVVDDSVLDQRVAGGHIVALGSHVVYAKSGAEAIEVMSRDGVDVVLTDLQMPEMNGLELVRELRAHYPIVPVMLMTSLGSEDIASLALKAGASSYVLKKNLAKELGPALKKVLAAVESARQRQHVRNSLMISESRFMFGYEPNAPESLISFLQDVLTRLDFCDHAGLYQVSAALTESIANAIEHGNLELDARLRESKNDDYAQIRKQRMQKSPYNKRHVYVTARLRAHKVTFVVRDEGRGFDPAHLPDPTDPENLSKPYGRGLMLVRAFMDEVRFNEQGNEITMVKRRAKEGEV